MFFKPIGIFLLHILQSYLDKLFNPAYIPFMTIPLSILNLNYPFASGCAAVRAWLHSGVSCWKEENAFETSDPHPSTLPARWEPQLYPSQHSFFLYSAAGFLTHSPVLAPKSISTLTWDHPIMFNCSLSFLFFFPLRKFLWVLFSGNPIPLMSGFPFVQPNASGPAKTKSSHPGWQHSAGRYLKCIMYMSKTEEQQQWRVPGI